MEGEGGRRRRGKKERKKEGRLPSGREDGKKKGWGWGQWRCPSEGHGRECGLRPSVQSGVPRCRARFFLLSFALSLSLSRTACCLSSCSSHRRGAAAQTAGMHQMHRTDRCPSRSTGFHLFTSDPVARARVFLSSLPGVLLLHPLPPCRAARFFLHGSLGLEKQCLATTSPASFIPSPPGLRFHLRSHRRRR